MYKIISTLKESSVLLYPKITMTLLVRNEEDIIADNIIFHHALGVDNFIVMDNLSIDATPNILQNLSQEIEIDYLFQGEDNYSQGEWVTKMAQRAALYHKADWVINSDADEFWMPLEGDLKSFFSTISQETALLTVTRYNAVVEFKDHSPFSGYSHPRTSRIFERNSTNSLGKSLPEKTLHRASSKVIVSQGNHLVDNILGATESAGDKLRILHYPYRSLKIYKNKIRLGGAAYIKNTALPSNIGNTWRAHYAEIDNNTIDRFWVKLSETPEELNIGLLTDRLFQEQEIVDFFAKPQKRRLQLITNKLIDHSRKLIKDFTTSQAKIIEREQRERRWRDPMYYNLQFSINGAEAHLRQIQSLAVEVDPETLCAKFSNLRDIFSQFPRNAYIPIFIRDLLEIVQGSEAALLRKDCNGKRIILHTSCYPRLESSLETLNSFNSMDQKEYHHIILLGTPKLCSENDTPLSFSYNGQILEVPVSDSYEHLHRKLFYAYMILNTLTKPEMVVKIDDNLVLEDSSKFFAILDYVFKSNSSYAGRLVGAKRHEIQWHGWHIGKCADPLVEKRGYQYPLPSSYASGGYGYVLGSKGLAACSYMYLAMKEFFAMHAIGLEDAYVGHAACSQGIELLDISEKEKLLAISGLTTKEFLHRNTQWNCVSS